MSQVWAVTNYNATSVNWRANIDQQKNYHFKGFIGNFPGWRQTGGPVHCEHLTSCRVLLKILFIHTYKFSEHIKVS